MSQVHSVQVRLTRRTDRRVVNKWSRVRTPVTTPQTRDRAPDIRPAPNRDRSFNYMLVYAAMHLCMPPDSQTAAVRRAAPWASSVHVHVHHDVHSARHSGGRVTAWCSRGCVPCSREVGCPYRAQLEGKRVHECARIVGAEAHGRLHDDHVVVRPIDGREDAMHVLEP